MGLMSRCFVPRSWNIIRTTRGRGEKAFRNRIMECGVMRSNGIRLKATIQNCVHIIVSNEESELV